AGRSQRVATPNPQEAAAQPQISFQHPQPLCEITADAQQFVRAAFEHGCRHSFPEGEHQILFSTSGCSAQMRAREPTLTRAEREESLDRRAMPGVVRAAVGERLRSSKA